MENVKNNELIYARNVNSWKHRQWNKSCDYSIFQIRLNIIWCNVRCNETKDFLLNIYLFLKLFFFIFVIRFIDSFDSNERTLRKSIKMAAGICFPPEWIFDELLSNRGKNICSTCFPLYLLFAVAMQWTVALQCLFRTKVV